MNMSGNCRFRRPPFSQYIAAIFVDTTTQAKQIHMRTYCDVVQCVVLYVSGWMACIPCVMNIHSNTWK